MRARKRVHGVAHRVGGEQAGVVAARCARPRSRPRARRRRRGRAACRRPRRGSPSRRGRRTSRSGWRRASRSPVGAVAVRAEQERHVVVVLPGRDREVDDDLRIEAGLEIGAGVEREPVVAGRTSPRSRTRPSSSVALMPMRTQPSPSVRSSTTGTPTAGRPFAVSSTCVVMTVTACPPAAAERSSRPRRARCRAPARGRGRGARGPTRGSTPSCARARRRPAGSRSARGRWR